MKQLKNIAIALASIVIFTNITNAQSAKPSYSVNSNETLGIKYLGLEGDFLTFQLSVNSIIPNNAYLSIVDNYDGVVYSAFFSPTYTTQKVKIERKDDQLLNFKLVIDNKTYARSISVNPVKPARKLAVKTEITML